MSVSRSSILRDCACMLRVSLSTHESVQSTHLLLRLEATMFIHSFHVGLPDAGQLVVEVLKVARLGPSLLLPFRNVFVEVIESLHDFFVGTWSNEWSVE